MSKILFIGGFVLIIVWAIGFFGFHKSGIIHILPAIAIIGFIIRLLYNKSLVKENIY
jgi:low affinity Fe/Cu permease